MDSFLGTFLLTFSIIVFAPGLVFLAIFLPIHITGKRYRKFVNSHSVAIKKLEEINKKYNFFVIPDFNMKHSYDSETFYDNISPEDYLVYQLTYIDKKVEKAMKETLLNKSMYQEYEKEIEDNCEFEHFDVENYLGNQHRLARVEKKEFEKKIKEPTTEFSIRVKLTLTNINGDYRKRKYNDFDSKEIKYLITLVRQKRGDFYLNNEIWDAICRVERGKVTNKMRFSIYNRDNYRCRICGKKAKNLEVDHIIPIAKGGKSTYENLQTLCHRCNVKKGDSMPY